MIEENDYTIEKAYCKGDEKSIYVFNDSKKRFVFYEFFGLLYHKEADDLPDFTEISKIDHMTLTFSDPKKPKVTLNDDIIRDIIKLSGTTPPSDMQNADGAISQYLAAIDVYFKDYPAYHFIGSIVRIKNGSYGLTINDETDSEDINSGKGYISMPSGSMILSYFS